MEVVHVLILNPTTHSSGPAPVNFVWSVLKCDCGFPFSLGVSCPTSYGVPFRRLGNLGGSNCAEKEGLWRWPSEGNLPVGNDVNHGRLKVPCPQSRQVPLRQTRTLGYGEIPFRARRYTPWFFGGKAKVTAL